MSVNGEKAAAVGFAAASLIAAPFVLIWRLLDRTPPAPHAIGTFWTDGTD